MYKECTMWNSSSRSRTIKRSHRFPFGTVCVIICYFLFRIGKVAVVVMTDLVVRTAVLECL